MYARTVRRALIGRTLLSGDGSATRRRRGRRRDPPPRRRASTPGRSTWADGHGPVVERRDPRPRLPRRRGDASGGRLRPARRPLVRGAAPGPRRGSGQRRAHRAGLGIHPACDCARPPRAGGYGAWAGASRLDEQPLLGRRDRGRPGAGRRSRTCRTSRATTRCRAGSRRPACPSRTGGGGRGSASTSTGRSTSSCSAAAGAQTFWPPIVPRSTTRSPGSARSSTIPRPSSLVAGRVSAANLAWLEARTASRTRALVEERGLRTRRVGQRRRRSVLGALLERDGPGSLGEHLARLGDGGDRRYARAARASVRR